MDNTNLPKQNNRLGTVMALGLGGLIIWNLLPPDWKENISRGIYQVQRGIGNCSASEGLSKKG